ncbi:uncharacterized protein V6R79_025343 [Siganus canaliculatus]
MMAKRAARQKNLLPASYYEGYLEKRSFKDKTSRKLWTCLCGNTLFFFNDKKDIDYVEKLDLSELIAVLDDSSQDRNLDAARLNLQMKNGNIKFTAPSAEARELWKGFINSVTKLSVPTTVNLLPGQIHMLKEAVEKEKERIQTVSSAATSDTYVTLEADMPACYHRVSRVESEILLSRETERGNLLLRPDGGGKGFAISTRQVLDKPVFKHYRVTRKPEGGFIIDVDNPIPCAKLHDVVNYLVEKTGGVLIPLILEDQYEKQISYIDSDKENGEKNIYQAPTNPTPPSVPPKPAPRMPSFEPEPIEEEEPLYLYMNDNLEEKEDKTEDPIPILPAQPEIAPKKAMMPPVPALRRHSCSASQSPSKSMSISQEVKGIENAENLGQKPEESAPKKVMMPPVPAPRRSASSASQSSKPLVSREVKGNAHAENLGQTISELKVLLEQRARCQ